MKLFDISSMLLAGCAAILVCCSPLFSDEPAPELIIEPPIEADNIQITEPVFGTVRNPGDTLAIKWTAPTIKRIDIQLFRKNEYKLTIAENLNNIGQHNWVIPVDLPPSNHYLIKIISHTNENIYNFSRQFGIQ